MRLYFTSRRLDGALLRVRRGSLTVIDSRVAGCRRGHADAPLCTARGRRQEENWQTVIPNPKNDVLLCLVREEITFCSWSRLLFLFCLYFLSVSAANVAVITSYKLVKVYRCRSCCGQRSM